MPTYTDIIADEIHAAGWSYGHVSYVDGRTLKLVWVADAHKDVAWRMIGERRCGPRAVLAI